MNRNKKTVQPEDKLCQIAEFEKGLCEFFEKKMSELSNSELFTIEQLPTSAGIYVIFENDVTPLYVGRSGNIRVRVQEHTRSSSGSGTATFAYMLAKREFSSKFKNTKLNKENEKTPEFVKMFLDKKNFLKACKFRFVEIENDILQTMFEPYAAYKLGTYPDNNTFENH